MIVLLKWPSALRCEIHFLALLWDNLTIFEQVQIVVLQATSIRYALKKTKWQIYLNMFMYTHLCGQKTQV